MSVNQRAPLRDRAELAGALKIVVAQIVEPLDLVAEPELREGFRVGERAVEHARDEARQLADDRQFVAGADRGWALKVCSIIVVPDRGKPTMKIGWATSERTPARGRILSRGATKKAVRRDGPAPRPPPPYSSGRSARVSCAWLR